MNEFRQVATLCDIVDLDTRQPFREGLANQLVEVLPRPEWTAGESDDDWKPWYYAKIYDDDGVRFVEGMIAKEHTKPLDQSVDPKEFALDVVSAAEPAGVDAASLLAVADFLSSLQGNVQDSAATGPFRFIEKTWSTTIADAPDLGLAPSDLVSPFKQATAAAAEAAKVQEKFQVLGRTPTAAELAFVRLFGFASVDLLVKRAQQPASPDPSIETVITNFVTEELKGTVKKDDLIKEISTAHPDLIGPENARNTVSKTLDTLAKEIAPAQKKAAELVAPIKPEPPQPEQVSKPVVDNLNLGINEEYRDEILAAATKCAMDPAGLAALIDAEAAKLKSGLWNKNSANPESSAVGLTQFLRKSWFHMATQSWTTLNKEAKAKRLVDANNRITNESALLALRTDPALSITSAAEYAAANLKFVMKVGPKFRDFYNPATPDGKMRLAYLCHHEGPGGALNYLSGNPKKGAAYVTWLDGYIDKKIVPRKFRISADVSPPPARDEAKPPPVAGGDAKPPPVSGDVETIPNVAFAELGAPFGQWHWPVVTSNARAMEVTCRTSAGVDVGKNQGRRFLAGRPGGRHHVGLDVFCDEGDVVLACADGRIVNYYHFYKGTFALLIEHAGVVVNYGEVAGNSAQKFGWRIGDRVTAGQPIGLVGSCQMIHFETYRPGTTANARWMQGGPRPGNLLNPTKLLLGLKGGVRKL